MTGLRLRLLRHRRAQLPQRPYQRHTLRIAKRCAAPPIIRSAAAAREISAGALESATLAAFRIAEGCAAPAAVTGLDFWVGDGGGVGGGVGVREGGGEGEEGGEEEGYEDEGDVS